ncbi:MAG: hypothetical protein AAGD23_06370 [Pseudomonadota bacterium]
MSIAAKSVALILGAGLLAAVFAAWQTPAMALMVTAFRYCF